MSLRGYFRCCAAIQFGFFHVTGGCVQAALSLGRGPAVRGEREDAEREEKALIPLAQPSPKGEGNRTPQSQDCRSGFGRLLPGGGDAANAAAAVAACAGEKALPLNRPRRSS